VLIEGLQRDNSIGPRKRKIAKAFSTSQLCAEEIEWVSLDKILVGSENQQLAKFP
jgi:hypothetical protein